MPELPPIDTVVGTAQEKRKADLWSLVLWSAAIPNMVESSAEGWLIKVDISQKERARWEITAFEEENADWPPPKPPAHSERSAGINGQQPPTLLLMGLLAAFYAVTGPFSPINPWFAQGAVVSDRILGQHEWWRLLTGLTLHADVVHLLGNLLLGGFLIHFLCKAMGSGLGWLLILLAGSAGNYLNILFRTANHNSVGFSTSVFGTVGILSARQCLKNRRLNRRELLAPLAAGLGLLAFLGTAGEHTDLGAHFFGFLTGTALGLLTAPLTPATRRKTAPLTQAALLIFCLLLIFLAWRAALDGS